MINKEIEKLETDDLLGFVSGLNISPKVTAKINEIIDRVNLLSHV